MVKHVVGGVLLGSAITIIAGLSVGASVTLSNVGSGNIGDKNGRYAFQVDEKDGVTRYTFIDSEKGVATVMSSDGKTVTIQAPKAPAEAEAPK